MITAGRPTDVAPRWSVLLGVLAATFALFQAMGDVLGSGRGEAGLAIGAAVVGVLLVVECWLYRRSLASAQASLGLGRPRLSGMVAAVAIGLLLLGVIPAYAWLRGVPVVLHEGWMWLLPGLFAQAGVAEETLFRGFLFRRLRQGRSFWRAATLAAIPFVLAHLILFATLPWTVAAASVLLATVMSFALAHLFELGGDTIWPPAIVHFVVQGAIKLLEVPGDAQLPLVWIGACAVLPYLAFLLRRPVPPASATIAHATH